MLLVCSDLDATLLDHENYSFNPAKPALKLLEKYSIEEHKKAISNSTHFNPVMLICGITNYKGEKFSLHDFRNEKRSMISKKVYKNKLIKILEWPGLWNGGMAEWNSIFVEVPKETFNPVKSIIDLLR